MLLVQTEAQQRQFMKTGKPAALRFTICVLLSSHQLALADETSMLEEMPKTMELEGKIELPATMPPMNPKWKTGSRFDFKMLPNAGSESLTWWKVPHWLQGTWRTEGKIKRLHLTDKKTSDKQGYGDVEIRYPDLEVIGYQQDREGYVWTCVPSPYVGRSVQAGRANLSIVHSAVPVVLADNEVVIRFVASTLIVDMATGKLISVTQRESLQTYRPIETGKVLVQAEMKFYDENGLPRYESKVLSQARRKGHFHETPYLPISGPVPTLIDLRGSFDNFLRTKHWEQLIPERYPLPPVHGYKMISL